MLDSQGMIDAVATVLQRSGYFDKVNQFELKGAPTSTGLLASVFLANIAPSQRRSGLSSTAVRVAFTCRLYMNMMHDPAWEIDPTVMNALDWVVNEFTGDFTLDGLDSDSVELDLLGSDGIPLSAVAGYVNVGGALQRVLDITVPIIVWDAWTQSR